MFSAFSTIISYPVNSSLKSWHIVSLKMKLFAKQSSQILEYFGYFKFFFLKFSGGKTRSIGIYKM